MELCLTFLFPGLLLMAAVGLMVSHVMTWRRLKDRAKETDADELRYRGNQFRRRMQSSAMLALLAAALGIGHWITLDRVSVTVFLIYWGCAVLIVFWVVLLAVADMISTKQHFDRLERTQITEKAKLDAEAKRLRAARGNDNGNGDDRGKPSGESNGVDPSHRKT